MREAPILDLTHLGLCACVRAHTYTLQFAGRQHSLSSFYMPDECVSPCRQEDPFCSPNWNEKGWKAHTCTHTHGSALRKLLGAALHAPDTPCPEQRHCGALPGMTSRSAFAPPLPLSPQVKPPQLKNKVSKTILLILYPIPPPPCCLGRYQTPVQTTILTCWWLFHRLPISCTQFTKEGAGNCATSIYL